MFATIVFSAPSLFAGAEPYTTSKELSPPTITQSEPWRFTIAAPGWMAGLDGTMGLRGINTDVDIGVDEILRHVDMIWATRVEASKRSFRDLW